MGKEVKVWMESFARESVEKSPRLIRICNHSKSMAKFYLKNILEASIKHKDKNVFKPTTKQIEGKMLESRND